MKGLHLAVSYPGEQQLCWEGRTLKITKQDLYRTDSEKRSQHHWEANHTQRAVQCK